MKKLLAVVLAAVMALSLGVVAFADVADASLGFEVIYNDKGAALTSAVTVAPDSTYYVAFSTLKTKLSLTGDVTDGDQYKVKLAKGSDNAKLIKKLSTVEKSLGGAAGATRIKYLKIEVNNVFTDEDYKLSPEITFTGKDNTKNGGVDATGEKATATISFWISNKADNADQDYTAGTGGIVLKPTKNEDNEINWEDNNNTIATLTFTGDDDGKYFYPKLSTKWEDADYAEYFADQNAYIFNFVGSAAGKTAIASTSRATLELYNPYYDSEEDALSVEPENVVIYSVEEDGSLLDVTASFKAVETDDGDYVFQTKTRELGVYIIAEKAAAVAAGDVEAPAEGGKDVPNTGRF